MTSCPGCGFLMSDDEERCSACVAVSGGYPADPGGSPAAGGATATIAPVAQVAAHATTTAAAPATVAPPGSPNLPPPMPDRVQYRRPHRPSAAKVLSAVAAVALLAAGVVVGLDGRGPLAEPMVRVGLAEEPTVRIPSTWVEVGSDDQGFVAALPAGADELGGEVVGYSTPVGADAAVSVLSTDAGLDAAALAARRSASGLDGLIDRVAATFSLGEELVRRDAPVAEGWAVDAVYVGDGTTTRVRFHLARDRLHVLATAGPDTAMDVLDGAHRTLLEQFRLA